jgi:hypothetical protein
MANPIAREHEVSPGRGGFSDGRILPGASSSGGPPEERRGTTSPAAASLPSPRATSFSPLPSRPQHRHAALYPLNPYRPIVRTPDSTDAGEGVPIQLTGGVIRKEAV